MSNNRIPMWAKIDALTLEEKQSAAKAAGKSLPEYLHLLDQVRKESWNFTNPKAHARNRKYRLEKAARLSEIKEALKS